MTIRGIALAALVLVACSPAASTTTDAAVGTTDAAPSIDAPTLDAACAAMGAPCHGNADCCSQSCSLDGLCVAPPAHPCNADPDCPSGQICQTCNHSCIFPPGGACDLRASCPCEYYCSSALCTPIGSTPPAMCIHHAECPIDQFCNRAVFQCQVPMVMATGSSHACTTNADCGTGEICSDAMANRMCVAIGVVECRTDADCAAQPGTVCTENQCFHRQTC